MSISNTLIAEILERTINRKVDEIFGNMSLLGKGPVFQTHAAVTRRGGLTKAVKKTKRSHIADLRVGDAHLFPIPKGVSHTALVSRVNSARTQMQKITGFKYCVNKVDGGALITRVP